MKISAIAPLTLIDFPDQVACTVFTLGCNFRCHYCYNSEFVLPQKVKKVLHHCIPQKSFFSFLDKRKGLLKGVCITGGEPTIHPDLIDFISEIKSRGFLVKLDTNGSNPDVLKSLLEKKLLDYVAMDIKAAPEDYEDIIAVSGFCNKIIKSKKILEKSSINFEFRTVMISRFHDKLRKKRLFNFVGKNNFHRILEFTSKNGCLNKDWER